MASPPPPRTAPSPPASDAAIIALAMAVGLIPVAQPRPARLTSRPGRLPLGRHPSMWGGAGQRSA